MPVFNLERVGLQYDSQTGYGSVEARQVRGEVWRPLEAALQPPAEGGPLTWLDGEGVAGGREAALLSCAFDLGPAQLAGRALRMWCCLRKALPAQAWAGNAAGCHGPIRQAVGPALLCPPAPAAQAAAAPTWRTSSRSTRVWWGRLWASMSSCTTRSKLTSPSPACAWPAPLSPRGSPALRPLPLLLRRLRQRQ